MQSKQKLKEENLLVNNGKDFLGNSKLRCWCDLGKQYKVERYG